MQAPVLQNQDRATDIVSMLPEVASVWSESLGDSRICIALLDGPVDLSHSCFERTHLKTLDTLVSPIPDQGSASLHGTHVASVIFGQHGGPVRGVAPGCSGLIIPVFSNKPDGTLNACSQLDLARAINQAVGEGAHVINISAGQLAPGGQPDDHLSRAVKLCAENDVLIVAAAGNEGCDCLHVPAALPSVLAVGAMDSKRQPLESSNWGGPYQLQGILALGENIPGAVPSDGVAYRSGTSMATPVVSGIAALLLSLQLKHGETPDPLAVMRALLASASRCEPDGNLDCRRFLAGRINIEGARALLNLTTKPATAQLGYTIKDMNQGRVNAVPRMADLSSIIPTPHQLGYDTTTEKLNLSVEGELTDVSNEKIGVETNLALAPTVNSSTSVAEPASPVSPASSSGSGTANNISPSDCACGGAGGKCSCGSSAVKPPLVYALGQLGHDFGTEARRDSFVQAGLVNPHDPGELVNFLNGSPVHASAVIWTLHQDSTPIYAVQPLGPFAANTYELLRTFMNAQMTQRVELISVPGYVTGKIALLNGQVVPAIVPEQRGMYSWSVPTLIEAVAGIRPLAAEETARYDQKTQDIGNFLDRVYYEIRNLGLAPQERAMNYAATNAFQVQRVFETAINADMKLDSIGVERSPICRPGSDCWDVKLTFFNPSKRLEQARHVYRFTVDVSDVIPVTVGMIRHWDVY